MKKGILIIAVGIVLLFGVVLYLSPPEFIFERGLPSYAKELPANFEEAASEFDKRIQVKFATLIEESQLVSMLSKEGFQVYFDQKIAQIEKNKLPCKYIWKVTWESSNQSVTRIKGSYGAACL